jgi:hypothetical protein
MTNDRQRFRESSAAGAVGSFLLNVMVIAWQVARVLIVALLMFVEPIIGFVLCGLALVGVIVSVILKFSGAPISHFGPRLPCRLGSMWLFFSMSLSYGHWSLNLVRIEKITGAA